MAEEKLVVFLVVIVDCYYWLMVAVGCVWKFLVLGWLRTSWLLVVFVGCWLLVVFVGCWLLVVFVGCYLLYFSCLYLGGRGEAGDDGGSRQGAQQLLLVSTINIILK